MQKNIHPQYRPVVFRDRSAGESFLTNSTRTSDKSEIGRASCRERV